MAEPSWSNDIGVTVGLVWDLVLDMISYTGPDAERASSRARQEPRVRTQ
jgi:hypothetical protein